LTAIQVLAWLPAALCGEIAKEVDGLLSSWAATWGLSAPSAVKCEPIAAGAAEPHGFIDLLAAPSADLKKAIAQALFKFDLLGSPVVDEVIRRATEPLARQLLESFGPQPLDGGEHGLLGDLGVHVAVQLLGQRCGFSLTCARLRACGKLVVPAAQPLTGVNLEHALAEVSVPLVAELGRADINLDELMQLAPGDVLLLRETLDAPLRVVAPGSALALSAHLGAISDPPQRAVRWLAS
jgi:hypothetical protein